MSTTASMLLTALEAYGVALVLIGTVWLSMWAVRRHDRQHAELERLIRRTDAIPAITPKDGPR
jgi:hypothetical protein